MSVNSVLGGGDEEERGGGMEVELKEGEIRDVEKGPPTSSRLKRGEAGGHRPSLRVLALLIPSA